MTENLKTLFELAVAPEFANKTAISRTGLSESLNYGDLLNRVKSTAEWLTAQNPNCVGLYADNSANWIIIDLACQLAKIPFLPIPLYFSQQQINHAIKICCVSHLLTDEPDIALQLTNTQLNNQTTLEYRVIKLEPAQKPLIPAGTAKITFTSGTTGEPKGVCLSSDHQFTVAASIKSALSLKQVKHLCILPLTTLLENVAGNYAPLLAGGEIIIPPLTDIGFNGSASFDVPTFLKALSQHRPESIILIPQILSALIAATAQGYKAPSSLKFIAVGGAKVSPELIKQARNFKLPVYEGYGLSECASVVSLNTPNNDKLDTTGKPLAHTNIEISRGEISIYGNCFLGYAGQPQSWYPQCVKTGDIGQIDNNGYLKLQGRKKNILISCFGRNINPEWLESELMANLNIMTAVVIGDDKPYCTALIFTKDEFNQSLDKWIESVNKKLPDYAQIKQWLVLPFELLTAKNLLTANGRVKRELINLEFTAEIASMYTILATGTSI